MKQFHRKIKEIPRKYIFNSKKNMKIKQIPKNFKNSKKIKKIVKI